MKRNAFILSLLPTLLFCGFCLSQAQAGSAHPPKEIAGLLALWDSKRSRGEPLQRKRASATMGSQPNNSRGAIP